MARETRSTRHRSWRVPTWHERGERIEAFAASRRRTEAEGHVSNWAEVNRYGPGSLPRAPWLARFGSHGPCQKRATIACEQVPRSRAT